MKKVGLSWTGASLGSQQGRPFVLSATPTPLSLNTNIPGQPGWFCGLVPALGSGHDPGDPGLSPVLGFP